MRRGPLEEETVGPTVGSSVGSGGRPVTGPRGPTTTTTTAATIATTTTIPATTVADGGIGRCQGKAPPSLHRPLHRHKAIRATGSSATC